MEVYLSKIAETKLVNLTNHLLHIEKQEIEIITFFDSKQNPKDLNKEII